MAESSNNKEIPIEIDIQGKTPKIRVVFMGTPQFAATILDGLINHHYTVVGVVTQPDKPIGRKQILTPGQTKEVALKYAIPILQPTKFDAESIEALKKWKPDLIIVAAYGKILPASILDIPGFGCVNVHGSILPKWRGASPIQNTLLAGETETGITLIRMDAGMDTGDIIATQTTPIESHENKADLEVRLAKIGSELLAHTLPAYIEQKITLVPQDASQATLCQLIDREDGHIFWDTSSQSIFNRYRALTPWPGIFTFYKTADGLLRLKLHVITQLKQTPQITRSLGEVFEIGDDIGVQTSTGVVILKEVQLEGKERVDIRVFINGYKQFIGSILQ